MVNIYITLYLFIQNIVCHIFNFFPAKLSIRENLFCAGIVLLYLWNGSRATNVLQMLHNNVNLMMNIRTSQRNPIELAKQVLLIFLSMFKKPVATFKNSLFFNLLRCFIYSIQHHRMVCKSAVISRRSDNECTFFA